VGGQFKNTLNEKHHPFNFQTKQGKCGKKVRVNFLKKSEFKQHVKNLGS
jgi:hypothetical protein